MSRYLTDKRTGQTRAGYDKCKTRGCPGWTSCRCNEKPSYKDEVRALDRKMIAPTNKGPHEETKLERRNRLRGQK